MRTGPFDAERRYLFLVMPTQVSRPSTGLRRAPLSVILTRHHWVWITVPELLCLMFVGAAEAKDEMLLEVEDRPCRWPGVEQVAS
jgi:hypothetical protein